MTFEFTQLLMAPTTNLEPKEAIEHGIRDFQDCRLAKAHDPQYNYKKYTGGGLVALLVAIKEITASVLGRRDKQCQAAIAHQFP